MEKAEELVSGCMAKARDDEPVFVLRASDRLAPSMVRRWVKLAHDSGTPAEKLGEALDLADRMEAYADKHYGGGKVPD